MSFPPLKIAAIAGFERLPIGKLLEQVVDFDCAVGIGYERSVGYTKDFHTHDRLNLAFPRGASRIAFTMKEDGKKHVVDAKTFLWMPADAVHRQDNVSVIYDNLAIFPKAPLAAKMAKSVGAKAPTATVKLRRSLLLSELLDRFFIERILQERNSQGVQRLGEQIIAEATRIAGCVSVNKGAKENKEDRDLASRSANPDDHGVLRVIKHIEANLFAELSSKGLAKVAGMSVATLFRKFQAELKISPFAYVRRRRLDEGRHLLEAGDHTVGDVALLVGYEDLAAFSKAFKAEYGVPPSEVRQ